MENTHNSPGSGVEYPPACQRQHQDASTTAESSGRLLLDPESPGFQYESLGRILRDNIIHGPMVVYQKSVTHDDFTASTFDPSNAWLYGQTGKAAADQYRFRKDHQSRWAEQNLVRIQMSKAASKDKKK